MRRLDSHRLGGGCSVWKFSRRWTRRLLAHLRGLDSIRQRTKPELSDWQWIDAGPCDTVPKLLQRMPYCSKGWYYRAAAAYLLERHKICWEDIKFVFNSTAHLPSDAFARAVTTVQDTWKRLPGCFRQGQPDLNKHSINSAIGAMRAKDEAIDWRCYSWR